ncbi:Degradation activator [Agrobacterium rosae]|uniref:Degradation activator n=2 Tax=Agrobacterium rosae TaxID=1972867 RepID=A0A1R3U397_9HYPH|nr:Degradation activator [Agrobacterium rosae]
MVERRSVTSTDVAREAGVSRTTVSFVLNGTSTANISTETRHRVLEVAARLGYTPSAAARALRRGQSDVVLCLLPQWPIHTAAGDYLEQLAYAFNVCDLTFVVHPHTPSTRLSEMWKRLRPAAVLTFDELTPQERIDTEQAGLPIVTVMLIESVETHANIGEYTNETLGRLQAQHLVDNGHLRLGYAYPDDPHLQYFAKARLSGVQQVTARTALTNPVVVQVALTAISATEAIKAWRRDLVTAVCAFNDEVAIALLCALHGSGLESPRDLAVIGIDDIPAASLSIPPLTTVRRSMTDMAQQTAIAVLQRLDRFPPAFWSAPAPAEVIERFTT